MPTLTLLHRLPGSGKTTLAVKLARTAAMPAGALEIAGAMFDVLLREIEPVDADEPHATVKTGREVLGGPALPRAGNP